MKFSAIYFLAAARLALSATSPGPEMMNTTEACYYNRMPNLNHMPHHNVTGKHGWGGMSNKTRKAPWGKPTIQFPNGTTCCSSQHEVQRALDDIDAKVLDLLSNRTAYSREAARFKSKEADIDDLKEGKQVVQKAIERANTTHLPQNVAEKVFESIVNSSVKFEECIFNTYNGTL